MQQTVTAKVQILPCSKDISMLTDTMKAYSFACNYVSEYIFGTHELALAKLHHALYYELRSRFNLKSQMAQSVLRTVVARYKAILTSQNQWNKAVFRKYQYDLVWNGKVFR